MSITIAVNADSLKDYVERKRTALIESISISINAVNIMLSDRVKNNLGGVVLNRQSGKLQDSVVMTDATLSGSIISGSVSAGGADAPYGIYFEKGGLGPYEIRPKNATVLAFMMAGQMMFAKVVHHPAIEQRQWWGPEEAVARNDMQEVIETAFDEVLNS